MLFVNASFPKHSPLLDQFHLSGELQSMFFEIDLPLQLHISKKGCNKSGILIASLNQMHSNSSRRCV